MTLKARFLYPSTSVRGNACNIILDVPLYMATTRGSGPFHRHTLAMWREFKVAADYSTGMSDTTRGTCTPPPGFVSQELGFGIDTSEKCAAGCRCNSMRPTSTVYVKQRQRRDENYWQRVVSEARDRALARAA